MRKRDPKSNRQSLMAGGSFNHDMSLPKIPGAGGQDYKGIPNATPEMLRKLQQRKMKNPGGQELPGFLKKASKPKKKNTRRA
jgi:hypothetical protein